MSGSRYERLERISWWDRERVRAATAVVAGCGALGNEVVKNLLLLGCGRIVLVDFDVVELSNLSRSILLDEADIGRPKVEAVRRQAARISPETEIVGIEATVLAGLTSGMAGRADVVLGCLDSVQSRMSLNQIAGRAGTLYIDGGIDVWRASVRMFRPGHGGPCYVCTLDEADLKEVGRRRSCPSYARRVSRHQGIPTTPVTASIAGALMVQNAVASIHGYSIPLGAEILFDARHGRAEIIHLPQNDDCLSHPEKQNALPVLIDGDATWSDAWSVIEAAAQVELRSLEFYPPLSSESRCEACGARLARGVRDPSMALPCPVCGKELQRSSVSRIQKHDDNMEVRVSDFNLPQWTWFRGQSSKETILFELCQHRKLAWGRG